jgi:hypothetical protein
MLHRVTPGTLPQSHIPTRAITRPCFLLSPTNDLTFGFGVFGFLVRVEQLVFFESISGFRIYSFRYDIWV